MEFQFTPDSQQAQIEVPFIEDATAATAPYYTANANARKKGTDVNKITRLHSEIGVELGKLGAILTGIIPGTYGSGKAKRYGYVIRFVYGGAQGVIHVAGLPMRSETPNKKQDVLVQALSIVRDWLKSAVTARVFNPRSDVLIPYLLVDKEHTVADYIADRGKLPRMDTPMLENGATEIVIE